MQHELIVKRYIKPLVAICDENALDNLSILLNTIATAYENEKFVTIMRSGDVTNEVKTALVLAMAAPAKSKTVDNLIKLLAENGRLSLIPELAQELEHEIARKKRLYKGRVYCDSVIDQNSIDSIARDLGSKVGATISLEYVPSDFDGVRVEVDDLNIEINFSKTRLNAQLVEHILKAI